MVDDEIEPTDDEITVPQDVVVGVHLHQHRLWPLRNLGTRYLIIAGCLTESFRGFGACATACDLGFS